MDYASYWGLRDRPFENSRSTPYFFESRAHAEALERLLYTVRDRNMGFGLLTGEIGSGKTMIWTVLAKRLPPQEYEVVSVESGNLPFPHLLAEILSRMDAKAPMDLGGEKFPLLVRFRRLLDERIVKTGRHFVLIVDEAQELDPKDLVELKNLTNLGSEESTPLTILLIGQPELREKVKLLPQLDQRISLRFHLNPLARRDVGDYLGHRLRIAGHATGDVFSPDCTDLLYRATGGIPRKINRICKLSLDLAFSLSRASVDEPIVRSIVQDLQRQEGVLPA